MIGTDALRDRLARGEAVVGPIINVQSPWLVDLSVAAGFDFVLFDAEHGPFGPADLETMIRAAAGASLPSFARVPANLPHEILRFLDAGVSGVKVPKVETQEQAIMVRDAVRYPPLGRRGLAAITHAAGYGFTLSVQDYIARANRELMAWAMVESPEGVDNIDSIAAVPGIDVISIGPGDLSVSMGFNGDRTAAPVREAIAHVVARCKLAGKRVSLPAADEASARASIAQGADIVLINVSPFFHAAARALVENIRSGRNGS